MLKTAFALTLFCAASITMAEAKDFKLGDDKPIATITLPDNWKNETYENGVEGTSADTETYVAAEVVDAKETDDAAKEMDKFFEKQKIKLKPETKKEKKTTFNGLPAYDIAWEATDEDGPTHVSVTLIKVAEGKIVFLTYWGTAAGEKSNAAALQGIAQSLKPIN